MKPYPEKIGIAGMHGKSSTVGMCDSIFCTGGNPATTLSGAVLGGDEKQGSFRKGSPETLLFEACEYKKSFLHFSPTIAVALNAEWEHTDCYASLSEVYDAFSVYLQKESVKLAVVPKELLRLCGRKKLLTFGEGMDVSAEDVTMKEGKPRFYLRVFGRTVGEVRLQTVGEYQVQNALAAAAVGTALEISEEKILSGLSAFKGAKRRFEKIG
ncbi:MAG: hypothetical protein MJ078_03180, partial [Clostridia bacterium]|nr:hypothetical protein [Clostridia bacterium]